MGFNLEEIDEGVRKEVQALREQGFETVDSGDGRSKFDENGDALMVCAQRRANIYVEPRTMDDLGHEIYMIHLLLKSASDLKWDLSFAGTFKEGFFIACHSVEEVTPAPDTKPMMVFELDDDTITTELHQLPHCTSPGDEFEIWFAPDDIMEKGPECMNNGPYRVKLLEIPNGELQ